MKITRRTFVGYGAAAAIMAGLASCAPASDAKQGGKDTSTDDSKKKDKVDLKEFDKLKIDMGAWRYDKVGDCYYQMGIPYCINPATKTYESLAIFVPGAYFDAEKNGSTFLCTLNSDKSVGGFTAATAPVIMPVNSKDFSAQACPTSYSYEGIGTYLKAGYVYVYAGFRGRSALAEGNDEKLIAGGAPWPVVDLKAAVRYLRFNAASLPINADSIFMAGLGGGANIASCVGASGDAKVYDPYLEEIGAITHDNVEGKAISDKIAGVAAWCPLVSLDAADSAYEWMMGQFSGEGTRAAGTWTKQLSSDLAKSYGDYLNSLGLADGEGNALVLEPLSDGTYLGGSYYSYVMASLEEAASSFLSATTFPYAYTPSVSSSSIFPGDPNLTASSEDLASAAGVSKVEATVYDSVESYLGTLNVSSRWITYNTAAQRASISSLWELASSYRKADHDVCAYDALDRSAQTNQLFGIGEDSSLHFDGVVPNLISANWDLYRTLGGWDETVATEWSKDIVMLDSLDQTIQTRVAMMNPLFCLNERYAQGVGTGKPAAYWRINTGVQQAETTYADEVNLALALEKTKGVKKVDFTPVWDAGFELAERSGGAQDNLVAWVKDLLAKK